MDVFGESHGRTEELECLRERLALISGAARLGFWEYDFETEELWISDELPALYGIDPAEFSWGLFTERLHPDDMVAPLQRPVPSRPFGTMTEFLFRVRHVDGSYRTVRSRSVTIGDGDRPLRKLGVHIDMTDDTLLRLANEHSDADRLRHFAQTAAHDLRSPLRAISALVGFVEEDHPDDLPCDVVDRLAQIRDRTDRLGRLIGDLLEYACSDASEREAGQIRVEGFLRDTVAAVDRRQAQILVSSPVLEPIQVVHRPLATCVRNLVDNACKHHDKPDGMVVVVGRREGDWLRVDVSDDGPGITPKVRDTMFEPLTTSDRSKGSGLGLSFVQRAVDQHHGRIAVDSQPGEGSTFTLWWPIAS